MTWSFSIGRVLGSDLRVDVTFVMLLGWVGLSSWLDHGAGAAVGNVLFVLLLFACVLAHEYGHALMARRFGIRTPDITLLPIGGLARLDRLPEKPTQEIAVALAGPAVNLAIWAFLVLVPGVGGQQVWRAGLAGLPTGMLDQLATVNLNLLLFNLLPAFPMDGGRVTRAVLTLSMGRARATIVAARLGQTAALAFGLAGLIMGNPFLVAIAAFVFLAARSERQDVAPLPRPHGVANGMKRPETLSADKDRVDDV